MCRLVQLCKDWRLLVELYLMEPAQVKHQLLLDPLLHSCLQHTFKVHIHSYIHIHIHVCTYIYIWRYINSTYTYSHARMCTYTCIPYTGWGDKSWTKLVFFFSPCMGLHLWLKLTYVSSEKFNVYWTLSGILIQLQGNFSLWRPAGGSAMSGRPYRCISLLAGPILRQQMGARWPDWRLSSSLSTAEYTR